ncbi:flagellar attachment zone protein 1-like [Palaemon carinicauda]|uniref:flagellar attachment zone protein 1-like n=1 Tax=Palaemon carinicauda TaxID=392227 RepID=UPI0035B667DF
MVSLEKAETQNDELREELSVKTSVQRLGGITSKVLIRRSEHSGPELDSVKAENKRLKTENVGQKAALESELNAAVEEVYRIGTKLDTALDENNKLKAELLIKKDVVCDLEMAEEELEKLWKEVAGVKAENRRLKRELSEERALRSTLMKADEKNKTLEEEIRNLTSVADEFAIYNEKYQAMMESNMNLEMELNHKNYAITQLVDGLSQIHPELKELYHTEISGSGHQFHWKGHLKQFGLKGRLYGLPPA